MSEKAPVAVKGESVNVTREQNTASKEELAAFEREFSDANVDTQSIIDDEQRQADERVKLNKLAELNVFLDNAEDRRRGISAIYGAEATKDLSDTDIEAFIADKLAEDTGVNRITEKTASPETLKNNNLPHGFLTVEEAQDEVKSEGPVKLGFWKRARLLAGAPGRAVWKGYSALMTRSANRTQKMNDLKESDPAEYDRLKKRSAIASTVGALAIAGALLASKSHIGNFIDTQIGSNGGGGDHTPEVAPPEGIEDAAPDIDRQAHVAQFIYNPAEDPYNQPGREGVNFTAGLDMSSPEAAKAQLLENWKHNPQQFATVMASTGMIENNPESIEHAADLMRNDANIYADNYDRLVSQISGPAQFREGVEGYGSFYAVDNGNGSQTIAYQSAVYGDKQPFLELMANGKPLHTGCNCGQVAYLPEQTPAVAAPAAPAPQGGGGHEVAPAAYAPSEPTPQGGGDYTPPPTPETPPETPVTPPPTPEEPPVVLPPENPPVAPPPPPEEPPVVVPPEVKDWNKQIDTEMDPLGLGQVTENSAIVGNGTKSSDITGSEKIDAPALGAKVQDAVTGLGGGRTAETGDKGAGAAAADLGQSSESATEKATKATGGAAGSADAPSTGRVE